jgi:HEPN domain-containing protein
MSKLPLSDRDFLRAAKQRLTVAEFLMKHRYTLDSMYLAGYAIECALKALILNKAPVEIRDDIFTRITSGTRMHYVESLGVIVKDLGCPLPLELVKRIRRSRWRTELRYTSGRTNTGETRGFLKTCDAVYNWVERQMV